MQVKMQLRVVRIESYNKIKECTATRLRCYGVATGYEILAMRTDSLLLCSIIFLSWFHFILDLVTAKYFCKSVVSWNSLVQNIFKNLQQLTVKHKGIILKKNLKCIL